MEKDGISVWVNVALNGRHNTVLRFGIKHRPRQHLVKDCPLSRPNRKAAKKRKGLSSIPPVSKGAFAKEGHHNTPPVPEVLFHLLPFQADWKAEFPPLHQCGREMKILSEKFAFTKNLTSQEKSVCRYHRKFMASSQRLPAPEQTLMRILKKAKSNTCTCVSK